MGRPVHAGSWLELWHSTNRLGAQLSESQLTVGEGPSMDARRGHGPVLISDLTTSASCARMIAAQLGVPMSEAFIRLRAKAFADHRPLAELADQVVARHLRFDLAGD
ncbi:hypothetical protein D5S17_17295 [Pseudonocardiaceae bacterium YIM PH 21723]|nr:hypothetical protein D5S17_17295 [Pseudonocardiaceae bacterium YIM PH 21723]